ncbi:MAG: alpha/beta fold hydrolase [Chloroflexota bacterium]|nr:alpha/beta fold hydrolase [Chloroflexota bacterium]MDE3102681.1 alpha/beta fold hydrolase [Chloroflexota bacterium]
MDARTITIDGLRIRVIDAAPERESDDAVLMIHGLGGWAENWREVVPAIVASGRRAVAMDLPGFGASQRARRPRYFDPDDPLYPPLLLHVLDELAIDRAHLVGHSFGGSVAYMTAVWRPERVRSLTLIAPGGLVAELDASFRLLTLPGVGLFARLARSDAATRQALYACFHDPARCPADVVEEARRYAGPAIGEMVRVLRSSVSFRSGVREKVRRPWVERHTRYSGPALVVWGVEDRVLPSSQARDVHAIAPAARVELIPACGHLVMIERPRELLDLLLPFLDSAAAVAAASR